MKKGKLLWTILKRTNVDKIVSGFLVFFLLNAVTLWLIEPTIDTYGDAIWYSFLVISTIGFGDIVAVTVVGRICSIILGLYGVFVLALIPGVVTSYYLEFQKLRIHESETCFLEKMENLDKLSKEELKELSEKIKHRKFKM
ncbi:MAG: potassium channel family protein [Lachnospiraceae bacterium]